MIQQILQQLLLDGHELYGKVCKVDKVNGMSCDCSPIDGSAAVNDVRITADFDSANKFVLIPKVGSLVIVSFLNNDIGYVSMVNEVSEVLYKNGDTVFRVDDKFLLASGTENLLTLMLDLIQAMIDERHMTNTGPTISLTPDSITKYEGIKTRFGTLLKSS
jgi:hypothetical protein